MSTIVVIVNTMHIWDECMKVEYNTKINAAAKGSPNISNFCTFFLLIVVHFSPMECNQLTSLEGKHLHHHHHRQ